ncbi:CehA/McbA family metallohydrolase [Bacillaceae bacterium SIJ1]|uniref:CehA/McbA family metallohydrolase n=1 Tax=Litoribacterium kuwaitense TaxID=1398745 RepID=UPI0013EDC01D|nr:CehA/McbA family metallohydrolase [Litoribacterium kuwaitense]NGP44972.1 CehA/McbA family metallohydrolase [Litoribacterium kuwaitense]
MKSKRVHVITGMITMLLLLLSSFPTATGAENDRAEYLQMKLYRGELHAHTSISDGVLMPKDAFEHVQANTALDFFGTTEHDVTYDISSGNSYLQKYEDSYSEEFKVVHEQHNDYNSREFVTVPGTEVTWYDQAGHVNLFNTEWFPRTYGKGATGQFGMGDLKYDLPTFYGRVSQDQDAIVQFNHPDAGGKGDFFGFSHFNEEVDRNVTLFEYKVARYFDTYIQALDQGWHVSPTYGGDEHSANWGSNNPALTGLWTTSLTREEIYDAMRNRRTYSSFDENFVFAFSANGQILGSILPSDTEEIEVNMVFRDPDQEDHIDRVVIYTNEGEVVKEYTNIADNEFSKNETLPSENGDYFLVRVFQADGDEIIGAPIWIGDVTRGTDFAPEIAVHGKLPKKVKLGDTVQIPDAVATDDSGDAPEVTVDVFNSKGHVNVENQAFLIEEYGEYFVRYYATDGAGNSRAELIQIDVKDNQLDADKVLNEFSPVVNVGANEQEVGINLVTDRVVDQAYVQYKRAEDSWKKAPTVKTNVSYFESAYGDDIDSSHYRILAAHEADLTDLDAGTTYEYRYGLKKNGPWGDVHTFTTATDANATTMYMMGDLQVPDRDKQSFALFTEMLSVLKEKHPEGEVMVQVGDLVDAAGSIHAWNDVFQTVYDDIGLLSANMLGNHEYVQDADASSFKHFFNLPKNGSDKEDYYSFDQGNVHVAVLNSLELTEEQLDWLEEDMRSTDKVWKVVVGHFPYYGGSHSDDPGMSADRAQMTQKMQQLGVRLYIGGHDHVYKRTSIRDGAVDQRDEAMTLGTTFITMGSSGPKFYDNETYDWDHIVYDDDVQTGAVLEADDTSLTWKAYNNNGDVIDEFTLAPPKNHLELTSIDVEEGVFNGIGILNYPESVDDVAVMGAVYDQTGELVASQTKEVALEHLGREQMIHFAEPLTFTDQQTVKLFVWDNVTDRNDIFPETVIRDAMDGDGTVENPYKIDSISDFEKINDYPDKHYRLTANIVGNNDVITAIGAVDDPFTGVFDGNGHTISGVEFVAEDGGAGLFRMNEGTIKNVAVIDAEVNAGRSDAGILADVNNGTIEQAYTTGTITGTSNVGGLVGYSNGVVRNSYSTANVKATSKQSGGLIGITNRGSITENVYATGSVTSGQSNSGGVSGYSYNNTVIKNSAALNPSVITISAANRIVARMLAGEQATLVNNVGLDTMMVSKEGQTSADADNEKGASKTAAELQQQATYEDELGWDFQNVWTWDETANRPLLQENRENTEQSGGGTPALAEDTDGFYLIESIADLQEISRFPKERYRLKNDVDFQGEAVPQLVRDVPFMGVFDGNGKTLKNVHSSYGALFHLNAGTIQHVAMTNADITGEDGAPQTGVLVNVNNGTVERSYSTGTVTGENTVGGLIGYSNGIVRDSYSDALVTATEKQAGGLIGITNAGSLTERSYATGNVTALENNAGGISGYAYNDTVVRNTIALNDEVRTPVSANRVVARVLNGHTATLENNFANDNMIVEVERITDESLTNEKGLGISAEVFKTQAFFSDRLGFDFDTIWAWDDELKRPYLK